jgi:TRAP-type C4-dicarboxylate transport system substrate-binding protein
MKIPAHVKTFNALGASATPMNFSEVYSALQQGVVDGQENPIAQIYSQRFYEVQKYLSLTSHVMTFYVPAMNMDFWNSLTKEDQQLLLNSMKDAEDYQQQLVNKEETTQIEAISAAGTKVNSLSEDQLKEFTKATESVRTEYKNKLGADIYNTWMKAIKTETNRK